jgi:ubiquinone/menaquinone biosynthesis C-methylase UbiE
MALYRDRILPHLIHWTMRQDSFGEYRQRVVSAAEGRVLEIGIGSGLNLPFYSGRASHVIGVDPSPTLLSRAAHTPSTLRSVTFVEGSAETIPLADASVDTVVTTWTLCSISDIAAALDEIRRVLRASGILLFVEHGRAPDPVIQRWQDRLTPLWSRLAGGCHLNRPVDRLLVQAGFQIERLTTSYMQGPRLMTFMYEGCARRRTGP